MTTSAIKDAVFLSIKNNKPVTVYPPHKTIKKTISNVHEHSNHKNIAEVVSISRVHGVSPGSVDVTVRNEGWYRVPLGWCDINEDMSLRTSAFNIIATNLLNRGYDDVNFTM